LFADFQNRTPHQLEIETLHLIHHLSSQLFEEILTNSFLSQFRGSTFQDQMISILLGEVLKPSSHRSLPLLIIHFLRINLFNLNLKYAIARLETVIY